MRKTTMLLTSTLVAALLSAAWAVQLRYGGQPNEETHYAVHFEGDGLVKGARVAEGSITGDIELALKVTEVDSEGNITLSARIVSGQVNGEFKAGEWGGNFSLTLPPHDRTLTFTTTPDGRVLKASGINTPRLKKLNLELDLNKLIAQALVVELPKDDVAVGAEWQTQYEITGPLGRKVTITRKSKLVGFEDVGSVSCAKIESQLEWTPFIIGEHSEQSERSVKTVTYLDPQTGKVVKRTVNIILSAVGFKPHPDAEKSFDGAIHLTVEAVAK